MRADTEILMRAILESVPDWYRATTGPDLHEIRSAEGSYSFYSFIPHGVMHEQLLDYINLEVDEWAADMPSPPTRSYLAVVREKIALHWLRLHEPTIAWNRLFSYVDVLSYRTHENRPVSRNLIIRPGTEGSVLVDEPGLQPVMDPLAGGPQTYLLLDRGGRYVDYEEALYCAIEDEGRKPYPEFLQPLQSQLGPDDYSLHLTVRRDVIVLGYGGMLAARRRGGWHVYDAERLQQDVYTSFGDNRLTANLFGVMLDLSYRGRGALLVYDPAGRVLEEVINANEAVISGPAPRGDEGRRMLAQAVKGIDMADSALARRKHNLFLEIASLDGAVLFDDDGVLAFGAMIRSNPHVQGYFGARTTAMHSAYLWGGRPIKVSTDGQIVIPFRSRGPAGTCEAELAFL